MAHDSVRDFGNGARASRSASWSYLYALGDGELEARLRSMAKRKDLSLGGVIEDAEATAREFSDLLDVLDTYDNDDAHDVTVAAIAFMQSIEKLCRNRIEAGQ